MIELLEDFIDFLKDKEEKVIVAEDNDAEEDDSFNKAINKIAKGE